MKKLIAIRNFIMMTFGFILIFTALNFMQFMKYQTNDLLVLIIVLFWAVYFIIKTKTDLDKLSQKK